MGFEKVLNVSSRATEPKRKRPIKLVPGLETEKPSAVTGGSQEVAPTHLAGLRSNAGIVQVTVKGEGHVRSDGPELDTLHTEEEFLPISPEPPEQVVDEDVRRFMDDNPTSTPLLV